MEHGHSSSTSSSPPPPDEIAFFDVETTIPSRVGQGHCLLEFGAILVCRRRLVEVGSYSTLIKPEDLSLISASSIRCNGITREAVAVAPSFAEVADSVYNILHGRVWAGHNILRFDCPRIREAFLKIGKPPPEPKGTIDSLPLLTQKFGRRAGNMKMATLAAYFGLGKQTHRSLDDVRMNLEVLKYCATVLFLESTASELSHANNITSSAPPTIDSNTNVSPAVPNPNLDSMSYFSSVSQDRVTSVMDATRNGICDIGESSNLAANMDTSLTPLIEQMAISFEQASVDRDENFKKPNMPEMLAFSSRTVTHCSTSPEYLNPAIVLKSNIRTTIVSANQHGCRMLLLYSEVPLQLCCVGLKVHFGISTRFVDHAGRPKLSFALGASESLCQVLDVCENVAQRSLIGFGSTFEWRPLIKKNSFNGSSIVRLNIPTSVNGDVTTCLAEVYQKESSGNTNRLDLSKSSADELKSLFVPGNVLDTYFHVGVYDYQQYSGIRLVAKRLVFHPI